LHDESGGALFDVELVSYECPKWFHADVDARIENPE
jgi:hypothetical protein